MWRFPVLLFTNAYKDLIDLGVIIGSGYHVNPKKFRI